MKKATEQLYDVFSIYKGDSKMEGSSLYGSKVQEWNNKLFATPLREL